MGQRQPESKNDTELLYIIENIEADRARLLNECNSAMSPSAFLVIGLGIILFLNGKFLQAELLKELLEGKVPLENTGRSNQTGKDETP